VFSILGIITLPHPNDGVINHLNTFILDIRMLLLKANFLDGSLALQSGKQECIMMMLPELGFFSINNLKGKR
jgi:hypothetical protein